MPLSRNSLALHTWTLDSTPLARVLEVAKATGWDAVELRRLDFERAQQHQSESQVLEMVRQSGLAVSAVGVAYGWMFADGADRDHLLSTFERSCVAAVALGSPTVMSAVDRAQGAIERAVARVRQVGDIAGRYNVRIALEFNSLAAQFNTLESVRALLAHAAHPAVGLLLDTYHLQRSGRSGRGFAELEPDEIAYVQYSDVPRDGVAPDSALPRLPPGEGAVEFDAMFGLLAEKGYSGPLSYEAPNPAAWERDPVDVAREALAATRAVLAAGEARSYGA